MMKNILASMLLVGALALPAHALDRGVYIIDGTNEHYFVDEFGSRHLVNDWDNVHTRYFSDTPIVTTKVDAINALPLGDAVTTDIGPDMVVKKKTTKVTTTDEDGTRTKTTKTIETETHD